jgi:mannose-1-phosphate guanylyltransferase/mannose-1-phosphate guanylyltransferase/mannose-6-phosphate isomerase
MSTPETPKQFLPLASDATMFEETLARTPAGSVYGDPIIVANARHGDLIERQLKGRHATIILEPAARNTAPAIALAAISAGDALILVMPSDHVITNLEAFQQAVLAAIPLANKGWLVTFGIAPDGPETGYGYIGIGVEIGSGVHRVARFIEKPDRARAEAMLAEGNHAWNGGIFLFRAPAFMAALEKNAPAIASATSAAMAGATRDGLRVFPAENAFCDSPSDSIDYAVMEKADQVAVIPVAMGWSDLGSWDALHDIGAKDNDSNVVAGNVRLVSGRGNLIKTDGRIRVSATGIDGLIIVASGDEVLILPRGQSQLVKSFSN